MALITAVALSNICRSESDEPMRISLIEEFCGMCRIVDDVIQFTMKLSMTFSLKMLRYNIFAHYEVDPGILHTSRRCGVSLGTCSTHNDRKSSLLATSSI
ncbi:MAG: hypothetical protein K0Q61_1283 [Rhodococcus erythropolis]|nr:hypothetical protein [Rhodococcus erythropolis]